MKKNCFFLPVLIWLLLAFPSISFAQNVLSEKGLTTAFFTTSHGNIKVYLPDDMRQGRFISGTIIAEPFGKNAKQSEKNLSELIKYSVQLGDNKINMIGNRQAFKWEVKYDNSLNIPIELLEANGSRVGALSIQSFASNINSVTALSKCSIPTHALTGSPLKITGPFDGDASNTKCSLDGTQLEILAESQMLCIVSYPADANGIKTMDVQETGKPICSQTVSSVQMTVIPGKLNLQKGEITFIDVTISGLQNLPDTALLSLNNITTNIVAMQPSDNIVIPILPDSMGAGTFNRRFDVHSVRTGGFTVNVNLALPEAETGGQPAHPQRGDTTVAQCPGCKCDCSASILVDGKKGDIFSYSVDVKPACTGSFGAPPCEKCIWVKNTYLWTISYSADKPIEIVGGNTGASFEFKNPENGSFTLSVKVTVTCSGGTCSCDAVTRYLATNPEKSTGNCKCKAGCAIKKEETKCGETDFVAVVDAGCNGNAKVKCAVASITYLWYIDESDKGVAGIKGKADGAKVKVKIIKTGSYTLFLKVIVTCTDGTSCESFCKIEETASDCKISYEWCAGPSIKVKAYGYYPSGSLLQDMRPGDLIGLSVFGTDLDILLQKCISVDGKDITVTPHPPAPDKVTYQWSLNHIAGTSGKLIFPEGKESSNSVLYQIPFCLTEYPVNDEIIVTLKNEKYKKEDEERLVVFSIRLGAIMENHYKSDGYDKVRSQYKLTAVIETGVSKIPDDISCPKFTGCCPPIMPPDWEEGKKLTITQPITFTFAPDSFPDNMVLLHTESIDFDNITIKCRNLSGEIISEKIENVYDDPHYKWKVVKGNASFISDRGPSVVLIHDYQDKTEAVNNLVIECSINDSNTQFNDTKPEPLLKEMGTRKKPVALVGVGNYEDGNEAAAIASCKYRNAGYKVILDNKLDLKKIEAVFKKPSTQAVFLIGNGLKGVFNTYSKEYFIPHHITTWLIDKWDCFKVWDYTKAGYKMPPLHPFIKELTLLGGEHDKGDWHNRFFRLEKYFTSEEISYAKEFIPELPRIAPPGAIRSNETNCCICGPDITATLTTTLNGVREVYDKLLTSEHQLLLCQSLLNPDLTSPDNSFLMAWDIDELKWHPEVFCKNPCCQPVLPCERTVQVGNGCYRASSVNYILLGVMCKLCGINIDVMVGLIQAYKGPVLSLEVLLTLGNELKKGRWPKGASNYEYSVLWAVAGYYYDVEGLSLSSIFPSEMPCQTKCPNLYTNKRFKVKWGSIKNFLEGLEVK